jgi:hypothetical protein
VVGAAGACSSFGNDGDAPSPVPSSEVDATLDDADCDATGSCDAGPEPVSIISPYRDGGLTYPEQIVWNLSAAAAAILHYTTDGTDPTPASRLATGTVTLNDLVDGTVVKWTVGSSANVHRFDVHIDGPDGGSTRSAGLIMENFRFETTTTAITSVPKGVASINVHADLRLWNQPECPTCVDFLTVGIDAPSDCFAASIPYPYPGATGQNHTFKLAVPDKPGVYPIRAGLSQVLDCNAALAGSLSDTQIGVLIVTP